MTAQIGDRLILNGETVMLTGCPALPWHHPRSRHLVFGASHQAACLGGKVD